MATVITLTVEQIIELAEMCGLCVEPNTIPEDEDELETEIDIRYNPEGFLVRDEDDSEGDTAEHFTHITYFSDDYDLGCSPLGKSLEDLKEKACI